MTDLTTPSTPTGTPTPARSPDVALKTKVARVPDLTYSVLIAVALLAYLQWGPRPDAMSTRVVPTPSSVAGALTDAVASGALWPHLLSTVAATLGGFLLATVAAVSLGALLVAAPRLERVFTPYIVGFQTLPKIAVAPLVILWLGFGISSKIAIVSFLSFFPIFVNCLQGFRIRDRVRYELFVSLGATSGQLLRYLRIPSAMPFVFAGLNVGLVFALVGSVVAEFVGSRRGLGVYLLQQKAAFNVPGVFAALAVLAALGLFLHFLIRGIERRSTAWAAEVTNPTSM
ncbi:MAG TPA: ABC transporter permease [Euzebya sp.]|nr:ABC transporter permease [Euzebya sp.]